MVRITTAISIARQGPPAFDFAGGPALCVTAEGAASSCWIAEQLEAMIDGRDASLAARPQPEAQAGSAFHAASTKIYQEPIRVRTLPVAEISVASPSRARKRIWRSVAK